MSAGGPSDNGPHHLARLPSATTDRASVGYYCFNASAITNPINPKIAAPASTNPIMPPADGTHSDAQYDSVEQYTSNNGGLLRVELLAVNDGIPARPATIAPNKAKP